LLARADRGRDLLRAELAQVAQVTQVAVYRQIDQPWMDEYALNELRQGRIDYVTLTSSNIARRFAEIADEGVRRWLGTSTRLVCISPVTAATAEEAGLSVAAVASTYTVEGLIQAIVEANRHPASVPLF
ncbi:MAG TPA: uroporphyrinogen-III synthase, partial [Gemmatales bacterium]|nr:uroporphyrinogen-III synthase [Gemmatales bacterium]